MATRAGQLRHRIALEQRTATQDTFGGFPETWSVVCYLWADINPLSGRERELAQAISAEITQEVTTRYQSIFSDINANTLAAYRLHYRTRILAIHGAFNVDERNREMTFLVGEGLSIE